VHHLRLRLEPAERRAGAGALPPHRPDQGRQDLPPRDVQLLRAGDVRSRFAEAGIGAGSAGNLPDGGLWQADLRRDGGHAQARRVCSLPLLSSPPPPSNTRFARSLRSRAATLS
jgi:hypothetical protein